MTTPPQQKGEQNQNPHAEHRRVQALLHMTFAEKPMDDLPENRVERRLPRPR